MFCIEGNGNPLSTLAQKIPWTEETGRLHAVHGVAKSQTRLSDFTFTFPFMHWRRKWQPTPVFLPGESRGRGSLVGCHLWSRTELDTTEATQQQQQQQLWLNLFNLRCLLEIQLGLKKENLGAKISLRINGLPLIFCHDPDVITIGANIKQKGLISDFQMIRSLLFMNKR